MMMKLKMENLHSYHLLIVTVKNQDKLQYDLVHSNLCMTFGGFFTSCLAWRLLTPYRRNDSLLVYMNDYGMLQLEMFETSSKDVDNHGKLYNWQLKLWHLALFVASTLEQDDVPNIEELIFLQASTTWSRWMFFNFKTIFSCW